MSMRSSDAAAVTVAFGPASPCGGEWPLDPVIGNVYRSGDDLVVVLELEDERVVSCSVPLVKSGAEHAESRRAA